MGLSKFINQEIYMYYTVNVNHNGMGALLPGSNVNGFKKCCMSNAIDETNGDMLWNGSEERQ